MLKKWQKLVKSLHIKKFRYEENLFLVEGEKSVAELLSPKTNLQGIRTEALFYTQKFAQSNPEVLRKINQQNIYNELVKEEDLESIGSLQANDSILAVAHIPPNFPPIMEQEMVLALADIRDPGNLGTIIRIADWYGINKLICSETTTDFYNPKVIGASMGSFLRIRPYYCDLAQYLADKKHLKIYGAFLEGNNIYQEKFAKQGIIVVGNESNGIPDEIAQYVPNRITIPRYGNAESLNVAIATAVICDNWRRSL
jgi:TrmH family RNA methyltransferase